MRQFTIKRGLLVVFLVFLLAFSVFAQDETDTSEDVSEETTETTEEPVVSEATGYDWLAEASTTTTEEVSDQALAIIALLGTSGKETETSQLLERLNEMKDEVNPCWPRGDCNTKDTALAALALEQAGRASDAQAAKDYMLDGLVAGLQRSGEWRIQIESGTNGTCTVSRGDGQNAREFEIEGQEVKGTANKYYIDVRADLRDRSLLATPNNELKVDCTTLGEDISGGNIVISLVYAKTSTELYLLQSVSGGEATLTIPNGCFGSDKEATRCDYKSTLYASWALIEMGEKILDMGTHTYLESNLGGDTLDKAILVRTLLTDGTTNSQSFINSLRDDQRISDGSWKSGDIFTTSFAVLALSQSAEQEAVSNGRLFLQRKQESDGSWRENIRDTSMALIALKGDLSSGFVGQASTPVRGDTSSTTETICNDGIDNDNDLFPDCGDVDCNDFSDCLCENGIKDSGEDDTDCGGALCPDFPCEDDSPVEFPGTDDGRECDFDLDCDVGEECDSFGECVPELIIPETDDEEEDTSNGGGAGKVILVILLILVLAGGGVFFYLKFVKTGKISFKKKPKGPTFDQFRKTAGRPGTRPAARPAARPAPGRGRAFPRRPAARPGKQSAEDAALEKSLREAEKLLKK